MPVDERCRYCNRPVDRGDFVVRRFWPFCSERCQLAELGNWFGERYVISREPDQVADDAATPSDTPSGAPDDGPGNDINT